MKFKLIEQFEQIEYTLTDEDINEFFQIYPKYINNDLSAEYIWVDSDGNALGYNTSHFSILYDIFEQMTFYKILHEKYDSHKSQLYDLIYELVYDFENTLFYDHNWIQLGTEHNELFVSKEHPYSTNQLYTIENYINQISTMNDFTVTFNQRTIKYDLSCTDAKKIINNIRRFQNGQNILEEYVNNNGDLSLFKINKDDIGIYPGYNGSLDLGISLSKIEKNNISKYCIIRTYIDRELYTGEAKEEGRLVCINPVNENIIYVPKEYNTNSELISNMKTKYDSPELFLKDLKQAYINYLKIHREDFNKSHNNITLNDFLKSIETNNLQKPLIAPFSNFQKTKLMQKIKENNLNIIFNKENNK